MRRSARHFADWLRREMEVRQRFVLPQKARIKLIAAGGGAAVLVFLLVATAPPSPFHPGRDAELHATYATYLETGVLLVKPFGTGSPGTQWPTPTEFTYAVFDDDPGIYLAASLIGGAAGLENPYRAIELLQAVVAAISWFVIPLLIARLFMRPRAGYAAIAAIPVYMLISADWSIPGTDYGRTVLGWEVYAIYGVAGSLVFFGLVMALWLALTRPTWAATLGVGAVIGLTAATANLTRAVSGLAILLATAVALLIRESGWKAVAGFGLPVLVALTLPALAMDAVDAERAELTGLPADEVPTAHALWHVTYLGLGYLGYGSDYEEPNPFGVRWSDQFAWEAARSVDPNVQLHSDHYEEIMGDLYFSAIRERPLSTLKGYLLKALDVIAQNGVALLVISIVGAIGFKRGIKAPLLIAALVAVPVILLGLVPPTLVMPFRYFFVELTAGLSLLFVVSVSLAMVLLAQSTSAEATSSESR